MFKFPFLIESRILRTKSYAFDAFRCATVKQDYEINCTTGLIICDNPKIILVPSKT